MSSTDLARAMRCPVLTSVWCFAAQGIVRTKSGGSVLLRVRHGTEIAYGATLGYAMGGTEIAYGAARLGESPQQRRGCYVLSGTELAYDATSRWRRKWLPQSAYACYAVCGTEPAYGGICLRARYAMCPCASQVLNRASRGRPSGMKTQTKALAKTKTKTSLSPTRPRRHVWQFRKLQSLYEWVGTFSSRCGLVSTTSYVMRGTELAYGATVCAYAVATRCAGATYYAYALCSVTCRTDVGDARTTGYAT
eukprot:1786284-Rhodomonas_salina.1